jgi:glycosyltransferase involved in cell wall biosynthesis
VAFLVQRIGPYHHARLQALAADGSLSVHAIEFLPQDGVYGWDPVGALGRYHRVRASDRESLRNALEAISPEIVVCVGYADPEIHRAVGWALRRKTPLVTCSDSTFDDEPRAWVRESLKKVVISAFDSGLVAGSRAHEYLGMLGMDSDRRFSPWDVVDNEHFRSGAESARQDADANRARLGLPEHYFLCVARFVPKKNLGRLVEAYSKYAGQAGASAWSLVLSGAGPLEESLREAAANSGLKSGVHFPGFLQYPDLPACYGLADAFVLPSTSDQWGLVVNEAMAAGLPVIVSSSCGCAPDLVRSGENGFIFDPSDATALAAMLAKVAHIEPERRKQMGARSREIIAGFTPEAFAAGLKSAVKCAQTRRRDKSLLTRMAFKALRARQRG